VVRNKSTSGQIAKLASVQIIKFSANVKEEFGYK
jgi:hypothetical protein